MALVALLGAPSALAQTVQPPFNTSYSVHLLGAVPGLPTPYAGVNFTPGDPDSLLIGGAGATANGTIYRVEVVRDANHHITGFRGTASAYAAAPWNDGGLSWGPEGVLFYSRYNTNEIGQFKPGATTPSKVVTLSGRPGMSVAALASTLQFVPGGFPGAGSLKVISYPQGQWYDLAYAPDGTGTFNVTTSSHRTTIVGGPEGFVYVPLGSPQFPTPSIVVSEYNSNSVATYEVNATGDAIPSTRRLMVSGLPGAEGAVLDPVTGDFVFSTWGAINRVYVVRGFQLPDGDGDGVPDVDDACPAEDATGADADDDGCIDVIVDTDGDGVPDPDDACPTEDATGADADGDGCIDDTDGDGVPDPVDACPTEAATGADADGDGCIDDTDGDGVPDPYDVCPGGDDHLDVDGDGTPDECDSCPLDTFNDSDGDLVCDSDDPCVFDPDNDADSDGLCADDEIPGCEQDPDNDLDGDGVCAPTDACPDDIANDADGDGICGNVDVCLLGDDSVDFDEDGTPDACDVCPNDFYNDSDFDGVCDSVDVCPFDAPDDSDADSLCDSEDICPFDPDNDVDSDGVCGDVDACPVDPANDADGDGVCEDTDNCDTVANTDQSDLDSDAVGDACEPDADDDGVIDDIDNCPTVVNPSQSDLDQDGSGDACDADDDGDLVGDGFDLCPGTPAGVVVTTGGCSVDQTCPTTTKWKNHGAYVSCVEKVTSDLVRQKRLTSAQRAVIVAAAAKSSVGHPPKPGKRDDDSSDDDDSSSDDDDDSSR